MAFSDVRKGQSPKPKARENAKNILCRNMTIYGSCRTQESGCPYSHENGRFESHPETTSTKRFLSVDSPSFTPLAPVTNLQSAVKVIGISPKAAATAVFTPRSTASTPTPNPPASTNDAATSDWTTEIKEFVPGRFNDFQSTSQTTTFDPFIPQQQFDSAGDMNDTSDTMQMNPYATESSAQLYQQSTYTQPLKYHLYAPIGPHRANLLPYQRTAHDLFIPDQLREELQRKSEASLQTFPNSTLPQRLEHFHSLVALDTTAPKSTSVYGFPSWLYKAVSTKDGYTYCLRRLENFKLSDEKAIRTMQKWKRVNNANVVTVHDAFTTRAFGDSSLIVVTDYHPLSQTLADKYLSHGSRYPSSKSAASYLPEQDLWCYIAQLASALKAIHSNGLAAQLLAPQKILMTSKNRLRLNTCGILDITQYGQQKSTEELQDDDLTQLGRLIVSIAIKSPVSNSGYPKGMEQIVRVYSSAVQDAISWLLSPLTTAETNDKIKENRGIDTLLTRLAPRMFGIFDAALHETDSLTSNLARELENARLVRLLTKMNSILERPESSPTGSQPSQGPSSLNNTSSAWSETGERYYLKLFRDYVFHQVDAEGRPTLDLGFILTCLNKLDAGIEEKILLVSRDEQNCFIVSYREIKRAFESAWTELSASSNTTTSVLR